MAADRVVRKAPEMKVAPKVLTDAKEEKPSAQAAILQRVVRKPLKKKKVKKQGTKITPSMGKVQATGEKAKAAPAPAASGLSLLGGYGSGSDSE
jgi:hypothetical protein